MGMKLSLARVSNDDINNALSEASKGGRYTGPTPPPDRYHVEVKKLWLTQSKKGDDMFKALFVIKETGDKKEYNGAGIFHTMMLPNDETSKAFPIQVSSIDSFFRNTSGGKFGFAEFYEAATKGKVITDDEDKVGQPIKSIGKWKLKEGMVIEVQTINRDNPNGSEPFVNVRYIVDIDDQQKDDEADNDDDEVVEGLDDDGDDVEGLDDANDADDDDDDDLDDLLGDDDDEE